MKKEMENVKRKEMVQQIVLDQVNVNIEQKNINPITSFTKNNQNGL